MNKKQNNTFFINTLIIIITNFVVKMLGLINKIAITRMLGTNGMSLYVLSFPTIMLFISIAGFSLNITISKLVPEAIVSRKYSPKKLVKKSCLYSVLLSFIMLILYLIFLKPLTIHFLKNEDLFYPLLAGAPLIMLVGISDGLKGYFTGIKKMHISSLGNLIEQIGRIGFSLIFLYIMLPYGIITATFFCLLALSFGEICAIIYSLIKIKKYPIESYDNTSGEGKAIIAMAVPTTTSRLIGNFTYFLEPILYTTILSYLGYKVTDIQTTYTILDAYTIPLLTFISFLPFALSTAMVPSVSEASALNKTNSLHYYIRKSLTFCLIPSIILSINLFLFANEYMNLIYGTTEGTTYIKYLTFMFICYYLHIPIVAILQASGYAKKVFITSTIIHITRLLLLVVLSFIPCIGLNSVLIATTATMILGFIVNLIQLIKITKFRFQLSSMISLILISIIGFSVAILLKKWDVHYLFILGITSIIILSLAIWQKLIWIESFKQNFLKRKKLRENS